MRLADVVATTILAFASPWLAAVLAALLAPVSPAWIAWPAGFAAARLVVGTILGLLRGAVGQASSPRRPWA